MPDSIFADPRLAPLYDAFDGERDDLDAYARIVSELGGGHVLDVGCGTGSLAVLLASRGTRVTGVDPAGASLDLARSKTGAETVTWIECDATALPSLDADIAVMTGNVAQVFLTDDAWNAALQSIRGALNETGHLVFETRRPEFRAWEQWAADSGPYVQHVAGIGAVERHFELTEIALPYVSFRYTYTFAGGQVASSDSTLRFRSREEIEGSLASSGFTTIDVRDAPDRPGREYVFVARCTT